MKRRSRGGVGRRVSGRKRRKYDEIQRLQETYAAICMISLEICWRAAGQESERGDALMPSCE